MSRAYRATYAPATPASQYSPSDAWLDRQRTQRAILVPFVTTVTANTTLTGDADGGLWLADATSAAFAVTLPLAKQFPAMEIAVKKIDSSVHPVTLTASGGDTLDGASTAVLSSRYDTLVARSDGGTGWRLFAVVAGTAARVGHALTAGAHLSGGPYDGSAAVTLATDATNANTASTLVARDASGNFSAGTITAALSGNASTASVGAQLTAANGTVSTEGNTKHWGIAQQSGLGAGFNIFTPVADYGTYVLLVAGKDAPTGSAPSNGFIDTVVFNCLATTFTPAVAWSATTVGAPGARTYTNSTGTLRVAIATGTTWYVDLWITKVDA